MSGTQNRCDGSCSIDATTARRRVLDESTVTAGDLISRELAVVREDNEPHGSSRSLRCCAHFLLICAALIFGARSVLAQATESPDVEAHPYERLICAGLTLPNEISNDQQRQFVQPTASASTDTPTKDSSCHMAPVSQPPQPTRTDQTSAVEDSIGKQPKRILWIIPNYRAVSANTYLPPLSLKGKFWLATQDTFDYSSFISVGILSGVAMASNSEPTFGQGAAGYGRYYWHTFADGGIENYMVEAIVPALTKEDPRYYTLGKGGFIKRTGYAVSRLFITRDDAGKNTFNFSEIVGAGAAAAISNSYYPANSNTWVKTYQRWGTQLALDGVYNILKEFWPDIDRKVFRGRYESRPIH